ncbi:DUF1212-domain-containing protein [Hortaea werneckii]|uniref:Threonine/serine exporter-like N-terminal domain-containing protein n=1 Tax=Hortaea werneckii TaxID=91943 RepID=A0A3M7FC76_HORWE|nr:DUF1212-domain-containing protein [Hortaea werneckii]KAI6882854.1 DUF1212-domain-containing protein [Hortaea werneckii]KAI6991929.1 DUF1212-domain-containing protein [Hortaea werneckii]KAI7144738.1 DUF1212-domain-containing protein [Hortaea werneckii]KAI7172053.1 DUF1212-domain-containing protein [Hortaea werneckii]
MGSPVDSPPNPFRDPPAGELILESPVVMQSPSGENNSAPLSSNEVSRPGSAGGQRREKKKVGFSGGTNCRDGNSRRISWMEDEPSGTVGGTLSPPNIGITPPADSAEASGETTPIHSRSGSADHMLPPPATASKSHLPELSEQQTQEIHNAFNLQLPVPKPRPAIRRTPSNHSNVESAIVEESPDEDGLRAYRQARAREAHERGKRLETDERARSEPNSRYTSPERPARRRSRLSQVEIPLEDLPPQHKFDGRYDSDSDAGIEMSKPPGGGAESPVSEAHRLVRKHTTHHGKFGPETPGYDAHSRVTTPVEEKQYFEAYAKPPEKYKGGILGALLQLKDNHETHKGGHSRSSSAARPSSRYSAGDVSVNSTPTHSPPSSGASTPNGGSSHFNWYGRKHKNQSTSSLAQLIGSSASLSSPVVGLGEQVGQRFKEQKEHEKQQHPSLGKRLKNTEAYKRMSRHRMEHEIRVTRHIDEILEIHRYLMKLCRALMQYGAPTHRLEEYMNMSARTLEIQAQFLYIPGSMIMSFDDPETHTTEVKLVRVQQGLDLGKLRDTHEVYKDVVHFRVSAKEGIDRLREVEKKKEKHSRWVRIPVYGLAAVCVGPFAFQARLIDLPIAFLLGCILGLLQLVVAPRSELYANVFEISATVITSFLSRAFGSIPDGKGGRLFCFSALAQSSIALILPGYIVLCASLELQSKSIVAGSIRMVYAIIYSLFLGFGITIGTAFYGIMDANATSATSCSSTMPEPYFFPFVPAFAMCLIIINQAKWKQAPMMLVIAFVGYLVNFYSSKRFSGNTQVSNTLGALAIGVMANTYSRIGSRVENWALDLWEDRLRHYWKGFKRRVLRIKKKGSKSVKALEEGSAHETESLYVRQTRRVGYSLAAAAMLPAIFVQVPSGLAVSGSLVSGIASADQIAGNATNGSTVVNTSSVTESVGSLNNVAFTVGYSVIQVAIGITVGLFLSAIVVYPFGKKRSGLFSF